MVPGAVVRTQSNIHDGAFSENREQFLAVNYFHKKCRQYMGKVFKSGLSKFCGRQPLKNLKGYGLLKRQETSSLM